MLISENNIGGNVLALFNSSNVKKSIYSEKDRKLMVYFIKERKKLKENDKKYSYTVNNTNYVGSVYIYKNVDKKLFEQFKNSGSQGNFVNKVLSKNNSYINKIILISEEIKDLFQEISI